MAARNRNWTPDKVREKIRTSMLVNRLQNHVRGKVDMKPTQIQAAGILLRKTLPDMVAATVEKHPLESLRDDELLATLRAIRGHLEAESVGVRAPGGMGETEELSEARALPTVQ